MFVFTRYEISVGGQRTHSGDQKTDNHTSWDLHPHFLARNRKCPPIHCPTFTSNQQWLLPHFYGHFGKNQGCNRGNQNGAVLPEPHLSLVLECGLCRVTSCPVPDLGINLTAANPAPPSLAWGMPMDDFSLGNRHICHDCFSQVHV